MDPLGDYLKQAREKKGVSFEHISSQTRIQEYHLQALESEDFAKLPAKVFAKGFVRSYAKALGLDEEEVLRRFLQTSATFYDQQEPEAPQPHAQITLEAPPRQGLNWSLVFGIIVVIAAIAIWYGLPKKQEDSQIAPPDPEASSPIKPIEEPILPIADSQKSDEPITSTDSVPTPPPPPAPKPASTQPLPKPDVPTSAEPTPRPPPMKPREDTAIDQPHTLEIEATQLTWVVVKSDEQAPNEALLQPGQRITWKADTQFQVTLGNAAGVVIRLNGQSQGPFGKPGQVVRDIRLRP